MLVFFIQQVKFRNYSDVYFELMNANMCCGVHDGVLVV